MTAPEVNFELSPGSTDALTNPGVKDEVIRAMAARANGKVYTPTAAKAPVALAAVAANPTTTRPAAVGVILADIPSEPGLYTVTDHGPFRIEGQVISFERTGSLLVSGVTAGIKSRKINVQLPGAHSPNVFGKSTEFFYRMSPEMIQQGGGPGDLVLLRMEVKGTRRQVETGAQGLWRASKGISIKRQIETALHEVKPGLFLIKAVGELSQGEYGFYMFRGNVLPPYFYDFSVP